MSVVALSGGVGGAKLALGLYRVLAPNTLTVIVNTGDDFEHLGLRICPDIDTVIYTLAGIEQPERGWGRREETWTLMRVIASLGEETWFQLGDADTGLHVVRSARLRAGTALSAVTREIVGRLGIDAIIVPMTDLAVATRVVTDEGDLAFQDYFVRRRWQPRVRAIYFSGVEQAVAAPGIVEALAAQTLRAIVICPSNPYLSVDPLLAIPGLRAALLQRHVPLIAVCPLIGGAAVKGPTAKIMRELGIEPSVQAIAAHYRGLIDGLVIDSTDVQAASALDVPLFTTQTLMTTMDDRIRVARFVLECAAQLRAESA